MYLASYAIGVKGQHSQTMAIFGHFISVAWNQLPLSALLDIDPYGPSKLASRM